MKSLEGDRPTVVSYGEQLWSLMLDGACRSIVHHLETDGYPMIMLKGATIATWLYPRPDERTYSDLDILVPFSERAGVVASLRELGYRPLLDEATRRAASPVEEPLRNDDGVSVDLHVSLKGIGVPPQRAWEVLSSATVPWDWSGTTVRALAPHARAMHLALHLAQRGLVDAKAARDLRLGLERLDEEVWREASRLARALEAQDAFTAGLHLLPEGVELADRLELDAATGLETRMRASSASASSLFLTRALEARGRRRLALVRTQLFPSAEWMRMHFPAETGTPLRLFRARARRFLRVLRRLPSAARERRRYRLSEGSGSARSS
jgi:hypothetical protein